MKSPLTQSTAGSGTSVRIGRVRDDASPNFPDAASLAALRAWHAGLGTRQAVAQYLGEQRAHGQSSRAILGRIQRQLAAMARLRGREDIATLFENSGIDARRAGQGGGSRGGSVAPAPCTAAGDHRRHRSVAAESRRRRRSQAAYSCRTVLIGKTSRMGSVVSGAKP